MNEMLTIMASPEHKEMFSKTAQTAPGTNPDEPTDVFQRIQMGLPVDSTAPTAQDSVQKEAKALSDKLHNDYNTVSATHDAGLDGTFKALSELATGGASNEPNKAKNTQTVAAFLSGPKGTQYASLAPTLAASHSTTAVATSVLDTIVRIANYLGENDMLISEAIADNLINSILVEAKKKSGKKGKKENKEGKKGKLPPWLKKDKECDEDDDSCEKKKK